jgi:BMFP domain-containing protein YqiC
VRGLEAMERRIEQLEKRLAKVESADKPKPAAKPKT